MTITVKLLTVNKIQQAKKRGTGKTKKPVPLKIRRLFNYFA